MNTVKRERLGGIALFGAAALAMLFANSPASNFYFALAQIEQIKTVAIFLFFFSIGIELRHEITSGILSKPRKALVPVLAAIGGMIVPFTIFTFITNGTEAQRAWGVPISFDIAFALGALAIAGAWLPRQVRTFVMTVAVVDDSLAILILALFYTANFHMLSLVSLAAVAIGLFLPGGHKLQKTLNPAVSFIALPVFAFLSAGVSLNQLQHGFNGILFLAVIVAILVGKPLGVLGSTYLVTKSKLGELDAHVSWRNLINVSTVFALCFTVSMLMSELSLEDSVAEHATANLAVLTATTTMLLLTLVLLRIGGKGKREH